MQRIFLVELHLYEGQTHSRRQGRVPVAAAVLRFCRQLGLDAAPNSSSSNSEGGDGDQSPQERLAALQPPRPIDLVIQPETSVVVITGKHEP